MGFALDAESAIPAWAHSPLWPFSPRHRQLPPGCPCLLPTPGSAQELQEQTITSPIQGCCVSSFLWQTSVAGMRRLPSPRLVKGSKYPTVLSLGFSRRYHTCTKILKPPKRMYIFYSHWAANCIYTQAWKGNLVWSSLGFTNMIQELSLLRKKVSIALLLVPCRQDRAGCAQTLQVLQVLNTDPFQDRGCAKDILSLIKSHFRGKW